MKRTHPTTYSNLAIWKIAYPILLSLLMEHLINLTDTAFLGRVGEVELGASALAGVYYMAIFMLGFGFSIGAQIMIARRNGEGRFKSIGAIMMQSGAFLLILAAVMFVVSRWASPRLLHTLISDPDVYNAAVEYLNWRVYGFFFAFLAVLFRAFYVGITQTKILTISSVVMVLSNVVLNYGLIFGEFGLPKMGIAGAAIASSVSELVSLLFYLGYTWFRVDWLHYGLFRFRRFNLRLLKQVLSTSIWTMIQYFLALSVWFLFFLAVEHLGKQSLAISNIVRSISSTMFIIVSAYATTGNSLVSNLMGAGQQRYVIPTLRKITIQSYLVIAPVMLFMFLFPETVIRIYTDDPVLISGSVASLLVLTGAYFIAPVAAIAFNAISGTGNTRSAMWLELGVLAVYAFYIFYTIVYLGFGIAMSWSAEAVYWTLMFALSALYLRYANWRNKKI